MGAKQSVENFPQSKYYAFINYGYCKVWKRRDNNLQAMQQYDINIDNQQALTCYRKMWLLRTQEQSVIMAYYFTHSAPRDICGVFQQGSILTERIPYRLSQFSNLPYQEIIPILRTVLKAYKVLHEQYGLFQVRSTMIGINTSYQVKVWHHTDYSAPTPQNPNCSSLNLMIDTIIKSVEMNADVPERYPSLSQFMKSSPTLKQQGFDNILSILSTYKRICDFPKRKGLQRLTPYLRQDQSRQDPSSNSNHLNNISKINQINSSSLDKFSFRNHTPDTSSIHSSRRTVKNIQNGTIYTHKQPHYVLSQQKQIHPKSQTIHSPKPQKHNHYYNSIDNIPLSPRLSQRDSLNFNQSRVLEPIQIRKISFNAVNQPNNQIHPPLISQTNSSIDRRVQLQHHPPESIYTLKNTTNKYPNSHIARNTPYQQTRTNSPQPYSSLPFQTH